MGVCLLDAIAVVAGGDAGDAAEGAAEVKGVGVADFGGDVGDGAVGQREQFFGSADAVLFEEFHRRRADPGFEEMVEVGGMEMDAAREIGEREILIAALVNGLQHGADAADLDAEREIHRFDVVFQNFVGRDVVFFGRAIGGDENVHQQRADGEQAQRALASPFFVHGQGEIVNAFGAFAFQAGRRRKKAQQVERFCGERFEMNPHFLEAGRGLDFALLDGSGVEEKDEAGAHEPFFVFDGHPGVAGGRHVDFVEERAVRNGHPRFGDEAVRDEVAAERGFGEKRFDVVEGSRS
jgi:hypothetical protein